MLKHFFILTLKGIRYRPIRSWLTVLGIVIGIMLVVVILSLGNGIKNAISQTMQMMGSDLIIIFPGKETNPLLGFVGNQKFRERDLMALADIDGVRFVVPIEVALLSVDYNGDKESIMVHGAPWEGMIETFEESQGLKIEEGRWPRGEQVNEVVLGYSAFNKTFKNKVKIGDDVIIKSKRMRVVGTISEVGNQADDNSIYMSLDIFRDITGMRAGAGSALVKVFPDADVNFVSNQIRFQLSKQEVVPDFAVITPEKADRIIGSVLSIVELALVMIALISLIVGAVGVMNTMYTSVLERTKQIGIMKAVGASNDAILSLFLIESGMIGIVGGIIGVVLGIFIAYIIGVVAEIFGISGMFSFASLDFLGFFAILAVTFITGVVSGILPARQAAKMEPAEALRYE